MKSWFVISGDALEIDLNYERLASEKIRQALLMHKFQIQRSREFVYRCCIELAQHLASVTEESLIGALIRAHEFSRRLRDKIRFGDIAVLLNV